MSAQKHALSSGPRPLYYQTRTRLSRLLEIAAIPLLFLLLTAAVTRGQSALDGFDPNADGRVFAAVVQPDGKILLGGEFTRLSPNGGGPVTRNHIARLNADGTLDAAFNPNANFPVNAIVLQADGKILVGGDFHGANSIGGQTRNYIARLDAATGLADSFNPNANNSIVAIAVQPNGKIVVGGFLTSVGGQTRNRIARLDTITGLADSFDPNANSDVRAIAVQADGKILAGGFFTNIGGQARSHIARFDDATGLADSFDPNASDYVTSIVVQPDGKILVGGFFYINQFPPQNTIGGQPRNRIARLDPTSGLADSFNPDANGTILSIALQTDGKILVGGNFFGFDSIGGASRNNIARLDATTGLADSFDPNANGNNVYSIAVQADGKVLAAGQFTTVSPNGGPPVTRNRIARLEIDGRLDQTLNLNAVGNSVYAAALQPDGKILLGGNFTSVLGVGRNRIARLNSDGTLDATFNPNADAAVLSIVVQQEGKILVGGSFTNIGGQTRNFIARLNSATGLADSFDAQAVNSINDIVFSIAVEADGKILVGGYFQNIGGQPRNNLCRLDATTGLADAFNPNPNSAIRTMVLQTDGKVLAGGYFNGANSIGGQTRNYIARLDPATGLADSFDPNVSNFVQCISVQADGKILVGGQFNSIGGQPRHNVARLNAATGTADSFNPNASGEVDSIAVQADGKILVAGIFTSIGGQSRNHIARLDPLIGLSDAFNPDAGNPFVLATTVQTDGKVLIGGNFLSVGGQTRNAFARLTNDTAAQQNLSVTQTTITWTRGGSSPQLRRVTFEYSLDNMSYTALGNGASAGDNWILTGLNLPTGQNFYVRARGHYRCGYQSGSESIVESVRNAFLAGPAPTPGTLGNISTRLRVLSGDSALIGGLIATGTAPKRVIIRAIGPSLIPFGVPGALANPTLDLFQGSTLLFSNDDWNTSTQQAEIANSGLAPSGNLESAIIWTLNPGQNYTAVVRGINGTTGTGVVEAFDLDQAAASKLGNISTRGFVDVDDNVMIAGLIAGPGNGTSLKILVRALGPTLSDFGVAGALVNPTLDLVNSSGTVIRSNDNWKDDPQQRAAIEAAGLAPSHDEEAALVETVAPGAYTAVVRGSNHATGVGLVEAYNIP